MTYSMKELEKWLEIAEGVARQAGMYLAKTKERNREVKISHGRDVKILADTQSDNLIIDSLKRKSSFPIFTEESNMIGNKIEEDLMWIVDPLDGSLNFSRGIPISCVSIGLWKDKKPLVGVIYDFNRGEFFSGIAGKGAWLNNQRIKVSAASRRQQAVLCTGFPVKTDFSTRGVKAFIKYAQTYKKIRLFGSAALSLAYVAAGRADAYYESGIMIWDVAAGLAIVTGAGGKVQMRPLSKENTFVVYASNRCLGKER